MNGSGPGSCPVANCGVSGVEPSGSYTRETEVNVHNATIAFLDIVHRPVFISKYNVSETEFIPRTVVF
jgi:hypothetical protein